MSFWNLCERDAVTEKTDVMVLAYFMNLPHVMVLAHVMMLPMLWRYPMS